MTVTSVMTRDELNAALAPFETSVYTAVDPHSSEFVLADNRVAFRTGNRTWPVSSGSFLNACGVFGVPRAYAQKTPPELMIPHINYHMGESPLSTLTISVAPESTVIDGFLRGEVEPLRILPIVDRFREIAGEEPGIHHVSAARSHVQVGLVTGESQALVVGDPIRHGVMIDGSYALERSLSITAYQHRLICTNGATATDILFKASRRGQPEPEWLDEALQAALDSAQVTMERLRVLRERPIEGHTSDYLNSVFEEFGVPVALRPRVLSHIVDIGGVHNGYDLWNALTWVASNDPEIRERPRVGLRMMGVAGDVTRHPEFCESCHRVI